MKMFDSKINKNSKKLMGMSSKKLFDLSWYHLRYDTSVLT